MNEASFFAFLRGIDYRYYQGREEWGLDIYLSGYWALIPAALAVASATVFLLALFHLIPLRRHSIPALLGIGALAISCGLIGAYWKYRNVFLHPENPPPRLFTLGKGAPAVNDGQKAALLSYPLVLGGIVFAADAAGALFLLLFGGQDSNQPKQSRSEEQNEED